MVVTVIAEVTGYYEHNLLVGAELRVGMHKGCFLEIYDPFLRLEELESYL